MLAVVSGGVLFQLKHTVYLCNQRANFVGENEIGEVLF